MIVLGADTHKRSHTVAAVAAATGELMGEQTVQVGHRGFDALLRWARGLDGERVWALEDCRHVSGGLERFLIARGERVLRIPTHLSAGARKGARQRGKSDPIDALAVARVALQEGLESFPVAHLDGPELDLRLLVDHRERLVRQRVGLNSTLQWHLHDLWPELELPGSSLFYGRWAPSGPTSSPVTFTLRAATDADAIRSAGFAEAGTLAELHQETATRLPSTFRLSRSSFGRNSGRRAARRVVQTLPAAPAARPRRCVLLGVCCRRRRRAHTLAGTGSRGIGCRARNCRHRLSDGFGALDLQEVTRPVDRALLDVRERGAEELGDLHPQRLGLRADHGEDWPVNGGCLLGAERPDRRRRSARLRRRCRRP